MAKSLSILYVTSEIVPFVKVGGIADVSFSFPLAVRDIGHDIRVMLPKYGNISERKNRIHEINRLKDISIPIGKTSDLATVKSSSMNNPRTKVQAYVTTNNKYFNAKKGIYENIRTGEPYPDNDERFIFFSRSVIETCLVLGWFPDIIHCNDWQTALIPAMAKTLFPDEFKNTKFVFTIHNLYQKGEFPISTFKKTGLPLSEKENFIHKKKMNFIKGGIVYSDYVTTVSPSYAKEIKSDKKLSNGLDEILSKLKNFKGILNGIDPWIWEPSKDKLIKKKLESNFKEFKNINKKAVCQKFGLEFEEDTPLIAMISRLDEQKGVPLFLQSAEKLLKEDVQIIILGEGNLDLKKKLEALAKKYSDKLAFISGFDDTLAHQIEAGCDIYLLPSLSEPCGLNAFYSLAYGALPIARMTGGLQDIVFDLSDAKKGNGITFKDYKSSELIKAVKRALILYKDKAKWNKLIRNNMKKDYSWKKSVKEYEEIYKKIVK